MVYSHLFSPFIRLKQKWVQNCTKLYHSFWLVTSSFILLYYNIILKTDARGNTVWLHVWLSRTSNNKALRNLYRLNWDANKKRMPAGQSRFFWCVEIPEILTHLQKRCIISCHLSVFLRWLRNFLQPKLTSWTISGRFLKPEVPWSTPEVAGN